MNTKKSLKLLKADREKVRQAFQDPLIRTAEEEAKATLTELSKRIFEAAFPDKKVRDAIFTLKKAGFMQLYTSYYFHSTEKKDGTDYPIRGDRLHLGEGLCIPLGSHVEIPIALMDEERSIEHKRAAREAEIRGPLTAQLNSALMLAKTRKELEVIWPGIVDLMGRDWVDAVEEPNTLPALQFDALNAAMDQIKAQKAA